MVLQLHRRSVLGLLLLPLAHRPAGAAKEAAQGAAWSQTDPPPEPVWTIDSPVRSIRLGEGHWFFDFGLARFGQAVLQWPEPPAITLRLHVGERLAASGQIDRQPPGSVRYQVHDLELQPERSEHRPLLNWRPPEWLKAGYATTPGGRGEVMPFRYVELEGLPPDFDPVRLQRHSLALSFDQDAARFRSSSPELDAVWALCRHTTEATTFAGIYIDGDRERLPYEGDAHIQQLSHYALDRSHATARHTMEVLLDQPTWPAEWQMHLVMMAWEDLLFTGNTDFVRRHRDRLVAATLSALAREDGLIELRRGAQTPGFLSSIGRRAPLHSLIDWPPVERDGHVTGPVDAVVNAFHHHSLVLMARLDEALGLDAEALRWREHARLVQARYAQVFWDPVRRRVRDSEGTDHASLHSNLFALRFGLIAAPHVGPVLEHIRSRGMAGSVYAAQHLLDALYEHGQAQWALDLMRGDGDRSWLGMLRQGSTMTLEAWNLGVKPNLDWNHAWGTAPANVIARRLVGVRPMTPGGTRVRVQPQPGDLAFFEARVPGPRGPVDVNFQRAAKGHEFVIRVPAGTEAEFHPPDGRPASSLGPGYHHLKLSEPAR
jgi:alpha-L-rhamnosidase